MDLQEKINRLKSDDPGRMKSYRRMNETVVSRLAHEQELKQLIAVEQVEAAKLPRIFVVCIVHSRPGEPLLATMRPLDAENWVAVCPACVEQGKEIRDRLKLELTREEVKVGQKHGLAESPEVT